MVTKEETTHGVGIVSLLGIVFVILKLIGVIDWSWWWVTTPFWGPSILVFAILLGLFIFVVVTKACGY